MSINFVGLSVTLIVASACVFAGTNTCIQSNTPDEFQPKTAIPKAYPAIKDAIFFKPDDPRNDVRDEELVLGVTLGKESRAYPINMMNGPSREIVNDKLGEQNIAATW